MTNRGSAPSLRTSLHPVVEQLGSETSFGPAILHGVIEKESTYRPTAISPTGVRGLGQLTRDTIEELVHRYHLGLQGKAVYEPGNQVVLAKLRLEEMVQKAQTFYPTASPEQQLRIALHAYNAGFRCVSRAIRKGGVQGFTRFLPVSADHQYANKVLKHSKSWVPTKTEAVVEQPRHNKVWDQTWLFKGPVLALAAVWAVLWLRKMAEEFRRIQASRVITIE